jgi:hypothetical protein
MRQNAIVRIDPDVDFDWRAGAPSPWLKGRVFSARWTGSLCPPRAGRWDFRLEASGGAAALWLGGRLILDPTVSGSAPPPLAEAVNLPVGPVSFRLDYRRTGTKEGAGCRLLWRPSGGGPPFAPVPPAAFFPDRASASAR